MSAALRELLAADGGLLAPMLRAGGAEAAPAVARLAASGPRAAATPAEYELVVSAIHEGYLLHYGGSRLLSADDPDLALLAGDRLYALGLERLVALGDSAAVCELADVIALGALLQDRGDAELAGLVWQAGARAVGWGSTPAHAVAKRLAAAGDPAAGEALRRLDGGA